REWEPLAAPAEAQETAKGEAVSSAPRLAPSRRNWTPATATLSEALAATLTGPPTVAPPAGAVSETAGGVESVDPPMRTWEGILTTKASRRLPPVLLVQMKY